MRGGNEVTFKNEDDFHNYLVNNPESNYMWGDHQQLQITANRYNVKINVLTIDREGKGSILKEPIVPDPRLGEYAMHPAELTENRDMWLLYSNNNHYDALISKDHPLLTIGTVTEIEKDDEKESLAEENISNTDIKGDVNVTETKTKDKTIKELQTKLVKLEQLYRGAEEEIQSLQEEKERLKVNVNELTDFIQKKDRKETEKSSKKVCNFIWKEKDILKHTKLPSGHIEVMYNCQQCDFQSTVSAGLSKHMNIKHRTIQEETNDVFRCAECNMQFSSKWNLMNHKKDNHEVTDICEYFLKDKCSFSAEKCWNLHKKSISKSPPILQNTSRDEIKCYVCKQAFKTRNGMMKHRKQMHEEIVPECREFSKGNCDFTTPDKICWYTHTQHVDFQKVPENLAPPAKE